MERTTRVGPHRVGLPPGPRAVRLEHVDIGPGDRLSFFVDDNAIEVLRAYKLQVGPGLVSHDLKVG